MRLSRAEDDPEFNIISEGGQSRTRTGVCTFRHHIHIYPSTKAGEKGKRWSQSPSENIGVVKIVNVYAALHVITCVSCASLLHSRAVGMCGF